jgi:hypothetical protein
MLDVATSLDDLCVLRPYTGCAAMFVPGSAAEIRKESGRASYADGAHLTSCPVPHRLARLAGRDDRDTELQSSAKH